MGAGRLDASELEQVKEEAADEGFWASNGSAICEWRRPVRLKLPPTLSDAIDAEKEEETVDIWNPPATQAVGRWPFAGWGTTIQA